MEADLGPDIDDDDFDDEESNPVAYMLYMDGKPVPLHQWDVEIDDQGLTFMVSEARAQDRLVHVTAECGPIFRYFSTVLKSGEQTFKGTDLQLLQQHTVSAEDH